MRLSDVEGRFVKLPCERGVLGLRGDKAMTIYSKSGDVISQRVLSPPRNRSRRGTSFRMDRTGQDRTKVTAS